MNDMSKREQLVLLKERMNKIDLEIERIKLKHGVFEKYEKIEGEDGLFIKKLKRDYNICYRMFVELNKGLENE